MLNKCKNCGKEFNFIPSYCDKCYAKNNFLVKLNSRREDNYTNLVNTFSDEDFKKQKYEKILKEYKKDECLEEETTFNNIFSKEDTLKKVFFKGNEKEISQYNEDEIDNNFIIKKRKKLIKILFLLIFLFGFSVFIFIGSINNAIHKNQNNVIQNDFALMSIFKNIRSVEEDYFIRNYKLFMFSEDKDLTSYKNQEYLKILYSLVNSNDYKINGLKKIEIKKDEKILVTYDIIGENIYYRIFENILFKKSKEGKYYIDFTYFVDQYNNIKNN